MYISIIIIKAIHARIIYNSIKTHDKLGRCELGRTADQQPRSAHIIV